VTAAVPAATVLLLRDGGDGLEVFMLERHVESEFAGGALVFPGGKVDDGDRRLAPARWSGIDLVAAAAVFDVEEDLALGLHVAAVRETFEEAGVLLARRDGAPITAADVATPGALAARQRLSARGVPWDWSGWLADEGLVLDLGALAWWSWWVTPEGSPKRYDTRFFLAAVPPDQEGAHDRVETVASRWTTPQAALDAGRAGSATVVYPTRKNLEVLATFATAGAVLTAAAEGRLDTTRTQPVIVRGEDGNLHLRHPRSGVVEAW
jgi:8-oxo-dGTP pyrophosphatase MutT (NUDIX family)